MSFETKVAPTGWLFFERHNFTIRWRRGDSAAYVLDGNRMGDQAMTGVLDKVPVSSTGWIDFGEIRMVAQRWLGHQGKYCRGCGAERTA